MRLLPQWKYKDISYAYQDYINLSYKRYSTDIIKKFLELSDYTNHPYIINKIEDIIKKHTKELESINELSPNSIEKNKKQVLESEGYALNKLAKALISANEQETWEIKNIKDVACELYGVR